MLKTSNWQLLPQFEHLRPLFASLQQVFTLTGEPITEDKLSAVIRIEHQGRRYYLKRYSQAGKWLRRFLGTPRIQSEWQNLLWFAEQGIASAPVVAYGMEKRWGLFQRGAMITEEIPDTEDLAALARGNDPRLADSVWVNRISLQVADALRRMHQQHFVHNDYKWRNLLVDGNDRLYLIDCPLGAVWPDFIFRHRRFKDFAALDRVAKYKLRQTQRLRFYLQYCDRSRLNSEDKAFLRRFLSRQPRRASSFSPQRQSGS